MAPNPPNSRQFLAGLFKALREKWGSPGQPLTQSQTGERLDLGQTLISRVENAADVRLSTLDQIFASIGGDIRGAFQPEFLESLGVHFDWGERASEGVAEGVEPYGDGPRAVVSGQIGETGAVKFYEWQRPFDAWGGEVARVGIETKPDRQVLMFKVTHDLGEIPAGAWLLAQEIREGDERPRNYSAFVQYNRYGYAQPLEVFELAPDCEHLVLRMLGGKGSFSEGCSSGPSATR